MPLIVAGHPVYAAARKMLADGPRASLVSEVFSNDHSHALPQAGTGGVASQDVAALHEAALHRTCSRKRSFLKKDE